MKEKVTALIFGSLKYGNAHYRFVRDLISNIEKIEGIDHILLCLMDDGDSPDLTGYGQPKRPLDVEVFNEDSLAFFKKLSLKYSTDIFVKIHHPCGFFFHEIVGSALRLFERTHPALISCLPFESSPAAVIDIFKPETDGLVYTDYRSHLQAPNAVVFDPEKEFRGPAKKELMKRSIEFPQVLILELSKACNLRCEKCKYWKEVYKPQFMYGDVLENLLSEIEKWPDRMRHLDLTGPGEPLLFKGFSSLLYRLDKMDNNSVLFNTNGMLLNKENIAAILETNTTVCISLDAACASTYDLLQNGGNYQRVVDNIELLLSRRKATNARGKIGVSFVVSNQNDRERDLYIEQWRDRVDFIRFQALNKDGVANRDNIEGLFECADLTEIRCYFPERVASVKANGDVSFCIGKATVCGNLREASLYDIWNGEKRKQLLTRYYRSMAHEDNYCDNCYSRFCYNFDEKTVDKQMVVQKNAIVHTIARLN